MVSVELESHTKCLESKFNVENCSFNKAEHPRNRSKKANLKDPKWPADHPLMITDLKDDKKSRNPSWRTGIAGSY